MGKDKFGIEDLEDMFGFKDNKSSQGNDKNTRELIDLFTESSNLIKELLSKLEAMKKGGKCK